MLRSKYYINISIGNTHVKYNIDSIKYTKYKHHNVNDLIINNNILVYSVIFVTF